MPGSNKPPELLQGLHDPRTPCRYQEGKQSSGRTGENTRRLDGKTKGLTRD